MSKLEIEIGDTVRISDKSRYYTYPNSGNPKCEGVVIPPTGSWPHRVLWANGDKNSYQSYDLTLIKKGKKEMKEFTKSDLIKLAQSKNLFVRQRDGVYKAVLNNIICGESGFTDLSSIKENLTSSKFTNNLDIMDVYETCEYRAMGSYLQGLGLRCLWERTEQTPAQKEMAILQEQAKALQEQITKLQGKL
jgi:hypothetical protein